MPDPYRDYCPHCHRLVAYTYGSATGLWHCSRCGRPAPAPITTQEAISVCRTALDTLETADPPAR
jgi:ribosomal protein L37AE/L43A